MKVASVIDVGITLEDIDRNHRVGPRTDDKCHSAIIKLISLRKRDEMFQNKRVIDDSGKINR
ncbi:Uncharacterized protein GBIM_03055 [Gryllus bimaculatus]|nr:Uncharacterized protein GBIM_03055 [Gryllus bimaculatus]